MATPTTGVSIPTVQITPFKLYQALEDAKRRGGPSDYYGLGKALNSAGDAWDAMQRTMSNTMRLQDQEAQLNSRMDAGYYPAQAQSAVSQFNLGNFEATNKLQGGQDLQQAFKQAQAAGFKPGTPEFNTAMHSFLTTPAGSLAMSKDYEIAKNQLQNKAMSIAMVKQVTEQEIQQKILRAFVEDNKERYVREAEATGLSMEQVKDKLRNDALSYARTYMNQIGLQVEVDPDTGMITAKDAGGNEVPINHRVLADAAAYNGNTAAFKAINDVTKNSALYGAAHVQMKQMEFEHKKELKQKDIEVEQAKIEAKRVADEARAEIQRAKLKTQLDAEMETYSKMEVEFFKLLAKKPEDLAPGALEVAKTELENKKKVVDRLRAVQNGAQGGAIKTGTGRPSPKDWLEGLSDGYYDSSDSEDDSAATRVFPGRGSKPFASLPEDNDLFGVGTLGMSP